MRLERNTVCSEHTVLLSTNFVVSMPPPVAILNGSLQVPSESSRLGGDGTKSVPDWRVLVPTRLGGGQLPGNGSGWSLPWQALVSNHCLVVGRINMIITRELTLLP